MDFQNKKWKFVLLRKIVCVTVLYNSQRMYTLSGFDRYLFV